MGEGWGPLFTQQLCVLFSNLGTVHIVTIQVQATYKLCCVKCQLYFSLAEPDFGPQLPFCLRAGNVIAGSSKSTQSFWP